MIMSGLHNLDLCNNAKTSVRFTSNKQSKDNVLKQDNIPVAMIIDDKINKVVDVDGDNIPDVSHLTMCRKMAQAEVGSLRVIAIKIPTNEAYSIEIDKLAEKINEAADLIDKGQKVDAVSISISKDMKLSLIGDLMDKKIDSCNVINHKEEMRDWMFNPKIALKMSAIMEIQSPGSTAKLNEEFLKVSKVIKAIERITCSDKKIPVFLSAGNSGEEYFNLYSLARNVQTIGATDYNGNLAPFSADNTLMTEFQQGIFNVTPIKNKNNIIQGFDLLGKGKITIPVYMTSGNKSEVSDYTNKPSSSIVANDNDYEELVEMLNRVELIKREKDIDDYTVGICFDEDKVDKGQNKKVFPITLVKNLFPESNDALDQIKDEGEYVNATFTRAFKLKDDELVYDPDGSGRQSVGKVWGTSFSAPLAMAKYIKNKTKNISFSGFFHQKGNKKSCDLIG
ncbi:MAG: hypothetical protein WCK67_01890 [bacterium]